jgi:hypothetical protein
MPHCLLSQKLKVLEIGMFRLQMYKESIPDASVFVGFCRMTNKNDDARKDN